MDGIMAKCDLRELVAIERPGLHYPAHMPVDHPKISQDAPNIFHLIREEGPFLLQHPYQSFTATVERFLKEASVDPKVMVIKMTLYRTSANSQIIEYLLDAARNGKAVLPQARGRGPAPRSGGGDRGPHGADRRRDRQDHGTEAGRIYARAFNPYLTFVFTFIFLPQLS